MQRKICGCGWTITFEYPCEKCGRGRRVTAAPMPINHTYVNFPALCCRSLPIAEPLEND